MGALAIVAAAAVASGTAISAPLFGALAALALSAGAALSAVLELASPERNRVWRTAGWMALVLGWVAFAAMLLHAPLSHFDGLRILATCLLAGMAALQAWRWYAQQGSAGLGAILATGFALLALGTTWSGVGAQLDGAVLTAMGIAVALELCGTGSVWLAEASIDCAARDSSVGPLPARAQAAIQTA
jgi:CDP-diglyceride synthetase